MKNSGFSRLIMASILAMGVAAPATAADDIKVGFVTTLTTGGAVIGEDMRDAVNLALEHIGGSVAGKPWSVVFEDDGFSPETGKQVTDKLVKQENVDIVAGYIWSHVLMASYRSVTNAGKIIISTNAGPSPLAGKLCNENFFSTSWQNDQTPMALGVRLNQQGVKSIYVMAPNYAAGKDMVAGVERTFAGKILGKDLTKWGADAQLDFSAELAKAKASGAEALFVFYPGKAAGAFVNQYTQAGLQASLPLYSVFTVDAISLPKLQEAGLDGVLGSEMTQTWSPDIDNEQNNRFVSDFRKKYGRYPSFYAAQSYDAMFLIKSAAEAVNGDMSNLDGLRAALAKADYPSVRGPYSVGNNHMPIQNVYARKVVADADGNWTTQITDTVYENHQDPHAGDCKL